MNRNEALTLSLGHHVLLVPRDWAVIRGGPAKLATYEATDTLLVFHVRTDRNEVKLISHLDIARRLTDEEIKFWEHDKAKARSKDIGDQSYELFGVNFTAEQWAAAEKKPPLWDLFPPQREEFDSDQDYAVEVRHYANRVLAMSTEAQTL